MKLTLPSNDTPAIIDPKNLYIFNMSIGNSRSRQGNLQQTATWETYGNAEYTAYSLCACTNEPCDTAINCIQGSTVFPSISFPALWNKKNQLTLKACVDPRHSSDKNNNCGLKKTKTYYPHRFNSKLAAYYQQKIAIINQTQQAAHELRQAFTKYTLQYFHCLDYNSQVDLTLKYKNQIMQYFLLAPVQWFTQAAQTAVTQPIDSINSPGTSKKIATQLKTFYTNLKNFLTKGCQDTIGKTPKVGNIMCNLAKKITHMIISMGAMTINLSLPFSMFWQSVEDISRAQKTVPKTCIAEQQLGVIRAAILNQISNYKKDIVKINTQIKLLEPQNTTNNNLTK